MSAPASPPGASGSPAPSSDPIPPGTPTANTYNWVYRQLVTDVSQRWKSSAPSIHRPARSRASIPISRVPNSWHFLNAGLKKHLEDFEEEIRDSVLSQKVDAINQELKARKSGWQWFADIGANLIVSIATILVIGALLGGYQALSRFNAMLEQVLQLAPKESVPDPAQTGQPSRPPAPSPSD